MHESDYLLFLTTLGRELGDAIVDVRGVQEPSGQDCYSALASVVGEPVDPVRLRVLTEEDVEKIAEAFNNYFEVTEITTELIRGALTAALDHWADEQ